MRYSGRHRHIDLRLNFLDRRRAVRRLQPSWRDGDAAQLKETEMENNVP
jgi:hypothetical protein